MTRIQTTTVFILIISILCSCSNSHDSNQKENQRGEGVVKTKFDRHIKLEGQVNFRDLGNYRNTSGQTIKTGLIYRSGHMARLTEDDIAQIDELEIKTVVNFLTPNEIASGGDDRLPEGVRSIYLGIEGQGDEVDQLIKARKTGDFSEIPSDFNLNIHKILPETGKTQYDSLFHLLTDSSNYPIVFHCSHGIHRTGTAAAILLSLLEIPWDTIVSDYLLSNKYRQEESTIRINYLDSIARVKNPDLDHDLNREYITDFYTLSPDYIKGTKDHIDQDYGSFEQYAYQSGLSKQELERIRLLLLE